jgi:N-methylhydantoinase B
MSSVALGGAGWTYYETVGGGSGAGPASDGASSVQCHMTNTLNTPAEALEMQYPLRVRRFERAPGTGGAGQHRGGDGTARELEALADCEGTLLAERRTRSPYGLRGGDAGAAGADQIVSRGGGAAAAVRLPGKSQFQLRAGDVLRIQTPGAGGWGRPPAV